MSLFIRNACDRGTSRGLASREREKSSRLDSWLLVLTAILFLLLCLLCPSRVLAQAPNAAAISFGPVISPFTTISANAPFRVCLATATGIPCSTTGVSLYSDINLTQHLANPSFANSQGIVNAFTTNGAYQIQLTPVPGQTYTYYFFAAGGTGPPPGGVTIQTNSVNNLSQSLLNFVNGTGINPTNPSGGIEQLNCNTTAASGSIGCSFVPLFGSGPATSSSYTCASGNVSQEYYDLTPANSNPQIWICKQTGGSPAYAWQQLPNFTFPYPGAGVPLSSGSAWLTSYQVQGTDSKLLSSGTVTSSVGALLCTDAQNGATTSGCAIPPSLTIQHNDSSSGINQSNLDFNDTNPAAPAGFLNVTFLTDSTGRLSGYVPSAIAPELQMYVLPPDTNQGTLVFFTACNVSNNNSSLVTAQQCDAKSGHQATIAGGLFNHNVIANINWTNAVLPSGITPTNVTAVYLVTFATALGTAGNTISCSGSGSATASFTTPGSLQQNNLISAITGPTIGGLTCNMQISQSVFGTFGSQTMDQVALWVEFTGSPVSPSPALNIGPWLLYSSYNNELITNPQWPNGTYPLTVAQTESVYPAGPGIYTISDLSVTSGTCTGGGSTIGQCYWNGSSYQVFAVSSGGGGDTITSPGGTISVGGTSTATTLDIALGHANTWTALQTFSAGINLSGSSSPLELAGSAGTSGQCLTSAGSAATPTWGACGSGGGIGGSGTTGFLPIWTASTTLGNSLADYNVTNAGAFTMTAPLDIAAASKPTEIILTYNTGHAPAGTAGSAVLAPDSTGNLDLSDNNGTLSPVCTPANGFCAGGSATVGSAEVVSFSATPTFSSSYNVSRIVLTGNITSFTMGGSPADGQDKTLCFKQGSGPYTVAPPAAVHGFFTIGTIAADWNCQTFVYDNTDSIWQATGPGSINQ